MQGYIDGQAVSHKQLMTNWGYCAEGETTTFACLLRILRENAGHSQVYQRCWLGISELDFRRLQGRGYPRDDQFAEDVRETAIACNISNVRSFVAAMEQARKCVSASLHVH